MQTQLATRNVPYATCNMQKLYTNKQHARNQMQKQYVAKQYATNNTRNQYANIQNAKIKQFANINMRQ